MHDGSLIAASRLHNQAFDAIQLREKGDEPSNATSIIGEACRVHVGKHADVEGRFRYVDADKAASIGHEAMSPLYASAKLSQRFDEASKCAKGSAFLRTKVQAR